jgi:hypothetical protein
VTAVNSSFWTGIIKKSSGSLDAVDRINEVNFGLIMVLTFTCTINAATEGREEVRTLLWAALSCNVAWGIIDSFIYLFSVMMYRGETLDVINNIRHAPNEAEGNKMVGDALPPLLASLMEKEHISGLRHKILQLPQPPRKASLMWRDVLGAVKIFLLVFGSTFPAVIPFIFIKDIFLATRISNGIALLLLFITGYYFGKTTHRHPVAHGLMLAGIGALLVAMTIALGG